VSGRTPQLYEDEVFCDIINLDEPHFPAAHKGVDESKEGGGEAADDGGIAKYNELKRYVTLPPIGLQKVRKGVEENAVRRLDRQSNDDTDRPSSASGSCRLSLLFTAQSHDADELRQGFVGYNKFHRQDLFAEHSEAAANMASRVSKSKRLCLT
jgi:hypothetical protein